MSKIRVAVIGAGGKMGTRTSKNLAKMTDKYDLMLVENAPKGIESIHARGLEVMPVEEALEKAEVVVFAVPDTLIKKLSAIYVPMLKPGTGFLILDPRRRRGQGADPSGRLHLRRGAPLPPLLPAGSGHPRGPGRPLRRRGRQAGHRDEQDLRRG